MRRKRLFLTKSEKLLKTVRTEPGIVMIRCHPGGFPPPQALNWVRSVREWLSHGEDLGLEGKPERRISLGVF